MSKYTHDNKDISTTKIENYKKENHMILNNFR